MAFDDNSLLTRKVSNIYIFISSYFTNDDDNFYFFLAKIMIIPKIPNKFPTFVIANFQEISVINICKYMLK